MILGTGALTGGAAIAEALQHHDEVGRDLVGGLIAVACAFTVWAVIMAFATIVEAVLDIRQELIHTPWTLPRQPRS